jgi:hypothetical protein
MPRFPPGLAAGGGTAPAGLGVAFIAIAGVAGDDGAGVRDTGAGVATRGGKGVSTIVVAPLDGFGVGVSVVPARGKSLTGTLFNAARNASAD